MYVCVYANLRVLGNLFQNVTNHKEISKQQNYVIVNISRSQYMRLHVFCVHVSDSCRVTDTHPIQSLMLNLIKHMYVLIFFRIFNLFYVYSTSYYYYFLYNGYQHFFFLHFLVHRLLSTAPFHSLLCRIRSSVESSEICRQMIQYMRLKQTKQTGNTIREYLSMSDGEQPYSLLRPWRIREWERKFQCQLVQLLTIGSKTYK